MLSVILSMITFNEPPTLNADIIIFMNFSNKTEQQKKKYQLFVHIGFSLLFLIIILATEVYIQHHQGSDLIGTILKIASYTYGPLLGLFSFGILTKRVINDKLSLIICLKHSCKRSTLLC